MLMRLACQALKNRWRLTMLKLFQGSMTPFVECTRFVRMFAVLHTADESCQMIIDLFLAYLNVLRHEED